MREYKATMGKLNMPWFPVAGNHDIYMRGKDVPITQHEKSYEQHFGPLWSFEHKGCAFVVLFSDEGDPKTAKKAIAEPQSQVMSDEQTQWLAATLEARKAAGTYSCSCTTRAGRTASTATTGTRSTRC